MELWWRIELFNGLRARSGETVVTRFYSQRVGYLLAYLALNSRSSHSREGIAELIWPETDPDAARLNLRVGLASLRRQFEPPGVPAGSVIIADRTKVQLNPDRASTDVADFQLAVREAERAGDADQARMWARADELAPGELLPGCYEEWALTERHRLEDMRVGVLRRLQTDREHRADFPAALDYAHRILGFDTLNEDSHCSLIRLYMAMGQPDAARRQYSTLERIIRQEFGELPSAATRALLSASPTVAAVSSTLSELSAARSVERPPAAIPTLRLPNRPQPAAPSLHVAEPRLPAFPAQFTRFFGRQEELDRLLRVLKPNAGEHSSGVGSGAEPLSQSRLVTVTGPGGCGKTRLALELVLRAARAYNNAALFVPLAEVSTLNGILDAILAAAAFTRSADRDPLDQAIEALSAQPCLIILDNFEQLLVDSELADACAALVSTLRAKCPKLVLLVTSRQMLGIEGECECALEPLPTPNHPGAPERLLEFAAVQLFVDRAQASRADFQITPRNAESIAALCRRLEGLPLALELAASWARILTPSQMLERLSDRFDMLVSRRRDLPPRHRTLRAAIAWSFQLLSTDNQRCFLRLSCFRGGFTVEAAAAVCEDGGIDTRLLALTECSLIVSTEADDGTRRFSMLESLREFASEQIPDDERCAAAARHASYYSQLADAARGHFHLSDSPAWMERLETERENMSAALDWAFENVVPSAVEMSIDLDWFWLTRGYRDERVKRAQQVFHHVESLGDIKPRAILWVAQLMEPAHARTLYRRSLEMFRQQGDDTGIAQTLYCLGSMAVTEENHNEALSLLSETLVLRLKNGEVEAANAARAALAHVYRILGELPRTKEILGEQLDTLVAHGNIDGAAKIRVALANVAIEQGEYHHADALLLKSLETYRQLGQRWGLADTLRNLGNLRCSQRNYKEGIELLNQGLDMFRTIEDARMVALLQMDLGEHMLEMQDYRHANLFLEQCFRDADGTPGNGDELCRLHTLRALAAMDAGAFDEAEALFQESIRALRSNDTSIASVRLAYRHSLLHLQRNQLEAARGTLFSATARASEIGIRPLTLRCLQAAAHYSLLASQYQSASTLLAEAAALAAAFDIVPSARDVEYEKTLLARLVTASTSSAIVSEQITPDSRLYAAVALAIKSLSSAETGE